MTNDRSEANRRDGLELGGRERERKTKGRVRVKCGTEVGQLIGQAGRVEGRHVNKQTTRSRRRCVLPGQPVRAGWAGQHWHMVGSAWLGLEPAPGSVAGSRVCNVCP